MDALTGSHLRLQQSIAGKVMQQLVVAWRLLDPAALDATFPRYLAAVLPLVREGHSASSAAALLYLRERRASALGATGQVVLAEPPPLEQITTVARVTSVVPIKQATALGTALDVARSAAFVLASGDLSRMVLQGGRDAITRSAVADPRVKGWQRVVVGATCSFCTMLAGRAVYTESSVRFRAHGHCDCTAEEVYR